jgi:S-formylglutathione hydrolase FrmB
MLDDHVSLMNGWVPATTQVLAVAALLLAAGWQWRRCRRLFLPVTALVGAGVVIGVHWYLKSAGVEGQSAPPREFWLWMGLSAAAVAVSIMGWPTARWWRRGLSLAAIPLCLLSGALALNAWVGYFPTVQTAWNQLTASPLPDQISPATLAAMQRRRALPARGAVIAVQISNAASRFRHRDEMVYLPPAWFATNPPPRLPAIIMIGGEFNTPADWLRAGSAVNTIDAFANAHHGYAPVFIFVDSGGSFYNDTECVNGPHGNAADHLVKDVVPFLISRYGVSPERTRWGVVGWSMGGTCALDLTVMHPDMFRAFVDIAGDYTPNSGTRQQTIDRLFGGRADEWSHYDPTTVITRHGRYTDVAGWFVLSGGPSSPQMVPSTPTALDERAVATNPGEQTAAAKLLCALGRAKGINCMITAQAGKHDWPFAARAFATALPWVSARIGTPHVSSASVVTT